MGFRPWQLPLQTSSSVSTTAHCVLYLEGNALPLEIVSNRLVDPLHPHTCSQHNQVWYGYGSGGACECVGGACECVGGACECV